MRGKEYFAKEPEPGVFGSLEPEPLEKKPGAGAAWKKSREPESGFFGPLEPKPLEKNTRSRSRLEKNSGAGAAKKFAGSPALEITFYYDSL